MTDDIIKQLVACCYRRQRGAVVDVLVKLGWNRAQARGFMRGLFDETFPEFAGDPQFNTDR